MCREDAHEPTPALTRLDRPPAVLTSRSPPIRHSVVESLPHPSGSTQQQPRVSVSPSRHSLQLPGGCKGIESGTMKEERTDAYLGDSGSEGKER